MNDEKLERLRRSAVTQSQWGNYWATKVATLIGLLKSSRRANSQLAQDLQQVTEWEQAHHRKVIELQSKNHTLWNRVHSRELEIGELKHEVEKLDEKVHELADEVGVAYEAGYQDGLENRGMEDRHPVL